MLPKSRDFLTKSERSRLMSKIRSKGTKLELSFKKTLESAGIPFVYQPRLPGRPDFIVEDKIAVFCDSDFWHGRNWPRLQAQLRSPYWVEHINKTRVRDVKTNAKLRAAGFKVLRFWENEINKKPGNCVNRVLKEMTKLRTS